MHSRKPRRWMPPAILLVAASLAGCAAGLVKPAAPGRSLAGVWWNTASVDALKPQDGLPIPLAPATKLLTPESYRMGQPPGVADIKDRCAPAGVPRVWLQPYPFQIIEQPGIIAFVYEDRQSYRLVYLNEPLPAPQVADPWFFGHSVGHWEGDTLVVQSAEFNNDTRLDAVLPHSDQLKVTERFRTIEHGRVLDLHVTIEDPKTFTRPWTVHLTFARHADEHLAEYVCGFGVLSTRPTP